MSAWAIINALLGLSINQNSYTFSPKLPEDNIKLFFATPDGTAHYIRNVKNEKENMTINVLTGSFNCKSLNLDTLIEPGQVDVFIDNNKVKLTSKQIKIKAFKTSIILNNMIKLDAGQKLTVLLS